MAKEPKDGFVSQILDLEKYNSFFEFSIHLQAQFSPGLAKSFKKLYFKYKSLVSLIQSYNIRALTLCNVNAEYVAVVQARDELQKKVKPKAPKYLQLKPELQNLNDAVAEASKNIERWSDKLINTSDLVVQRDEFVKATAVFAAVLRDANIVSPTDVDTTDRLKRMINSRVTERLQTLELVLTFRVSTDLLRSFRTLFDILDRKKHEDIESAIRRILQHMLDQILVEFCVKANDEVSQLQEALERLIGVNVRLFRSIKDLTKRNLEWKSHYEERKERYQKFLDELNKVETQIILGRPLTKNIAEIDPKVSSTYTNTTHPRSLYDDSESALLNLDSFLKRAKIEEKISALEIQQTIAEDPNVLKDLQLDKESLESQLNNHDYEDDNNNTNNNNINNHNNKDGKHEK